MNQYLHFNKISRCAVDTTKSEKHWFQRPGSQGAWLKSHSHSCRTASWSSGKVNLAKILWHSGQAIDERANLWALPLPKLQIIRKSSPGLTEGNGSISGEVYEGSTIKGNSQKHSSTASPGMQISNFCSYYIKLFLQTYWFIQTLEVVVKVVIFIHC